MAKTNGQNGQSAAPDERCAAEDPSNKRVDPRTNRRGFLQTAGGAAIAASVTGLIPATTLTSVSANAQEIEPNVEIGPSVAKKRAKAALSIRTAAAQRERDLPIVSHPTNGDEELFPNKIGSFSKGLPHNNLGEVDVPAFNTLIHALTTGNAADFESITIGRGVKLTNPQSGIAFAMEGPDSHCLAQRAAPAFSSAEEAGEITENYWMALARDVPFTQYGSSSVIGRAAADLSRLSDFRGPKSSGAVNVANIFRGLTPGDLAGPYISQFLWKDTPFGVERVDRRMRTVVGGVDYLTGYGDWIAVQNGASTPGDAFDPTPRYITNGRDLGQWVHIDVLFQAYFNAMLILFSIGAPRDAGNPYRTSRTQTAFSTLGDPHVASLIASVATPALKAVWYQKWFVHRRLRPEAFAGRVHNHVTHAATYPIHSDVLNSSVLNELFTRNGSYLLPMAFPEGCPTHPAYGAGHATVAGACVTILKAFFDESFVIPNPVEASADGSQLLPYTGAALTVGGELNKLASNVAIGRNFAGVHWRSDATESLKLGEELAIRFLREEKDCFNETANLSVTKFDGTTITI